MEKWACPSHRCKLLSFNDRCEFDCWGKPDYRINYPMPKHNMLTLKCVYYNKKTPTTFNRCFFFSILYINRPYIFPRNCCFHCTSQINCVQFLAAHLSKKSILSTLFSLPFSLLHIQLHVCKYTEVSSHASQNSPRALLIYLAFKILIRGGARSSGPDSLLVWGRSLVLGEGGEWHHPLSTSTSTSSSTSTSLEPSTTAATSS